MYIYINPDGTTDSSKLRDMHKINLSEIAFKINFSDESTDIIRFENVKRRFGRAIRPFSIGMEELFTED